MSRFSISLQETAGFSPRSFIFLFSVYWLLVSGCSSQEYHKSTQLLMGTFVEVISDDPRAAGIAFAEIKRLDNLLSKFNPHSEVSQLNRRGKLKVSPDTLAVIKAAKGFYRQSGGAFDITVSPLVDIWKPAINAKVMPKENQINAAKLLAGSENIFIDEKSQTVKFLKKGMRIDLGGIAKGYAVDCAIKKLQNAGIKSCLVNAGGNMYGLGKNRTRPWKVGIRHPRKPKEMIGFILLEDRAIATSGDYEQYFESGNRRFSHIINPQTGYPVNNGVVSATVISSNATTCDALSTAVFVLGKQKGLRLGEKYKNTQVIILTKEDLRI